MWNKARLNEQLDETWTFGWKIQGAEHLWLFLSVKMDELHIRLIFLAAEEYLSFRAEVEFPELFTQQPSTVLRVHIVEYYNGAKLATSRDESDKNLLVPSDDVKQERP